MAARPACPRVIQEPCARERPPPPPPIENRPADRAVAAMVARRFKYQNPLTDIAAGRRRAPQFKRLPETVFRWDPARLDETWTELAAFRGDYVERCLPNQNPWMHQADMFVLFAMTRMLKPARVIEVGSGHSTRAILCGLELNRQEGYGGVQTCIEPFRASAVPKHADIRIRVQSVQDVPPEFFDNLRADDMLVLDTSHVMQPYGDVIWEVLWILPRLKPGVVVHIHDMFLPHDYPPAWMFDEWRPYTEQWLVAAFLHENARWEVVWSNAICTANAACRVRREAVVASGTGVAGGASLYIRKRGAAK